MDKWQPPTDIIAEYERLLFKYEDAAIYDNLVAIGQPDGKVTVVDLDGSLHAEFDVYEAIRLRWCDILINENYIICASTESNQIGHEVKVFSHKGKRLNEFASLPHGRPYMISEHKLLILSEYANQPAEINLFDLSTIDSDLKEEHKMKSQIKIKLRRHGVDHFCANEKILVLSVEYKEKLFVYSLETAEKVAEIDSFQPDYAFARTFDCVNYWFDIFSHEGKTYLATLEGSLKVWKIDDERAHLATNHARSELYEMVNEFMIQPSCRVTVKAENKILAISLNDIQEVDYANNSIYAIPFDVLIKDKPKISVSKSEYDSYRLSMEELTESKMIDPICVFEDMITSGISVSKSRIALLHCNGSISDLVSLKIK